MHSASIILALAAAVVAIPQGVTSAIAPQGLPPSDCKPTADGTFQITVVKAPGKKRELEERDVLTLTLKDGVLKDALGRTGYIADNYQFQFDGPPQAGAIFTAGFSLCSNSSLALGGKAIWYQCLSGGFYNLYDRSWAPQCSPIYIEAMGGSAASAKVTPTVTVTQVTDGQVVATTAVSQISDGQVIATTGQFTASVPPVSQISDGQVQNPKSSKVSSMPSMVHVSQMTDGQVIASPATSQVPVSQIPDGQIVATTPAPVAPVPTTAPVPVSQMTDGQPIAPAPTTAASNATVAVPSSPKPSQVTVNAAARTGSAFIGTGAVAVVVAMAGALL